MKFFEKTPNLKTASFDKNLCIDKTFEEFNKAENLGEFNDCGFNYESSGLTCQNWNLGFYDGRAVMCLLNIFNPYMRDDFEEIKMMNANSKSENVTIVFGESPRSDSARLVPSKICREFANLVDLYLDNLNIELITAESFNTCNKLESLYLSHNLLEELPQAAFIWNSKLRVLDLGSNQLKAISINSFGTLTSLEHFYIDHNPILNIDPYFFNSAINLKSLWMSGLKLDYFATSWFENLEKLEELRLDETDLSFLPPDAFSKLVNLTKLQFSSNYIKTLSIKLPQNITELHFSNNQIDMIIPTFFDELQQLKLVSFEGNECVDAKIEDFSATRIDSLEKFAKCFENYNEGNISGANNVFIAKILLIFSFFLFL